MLSVLLVVAAARARRGLAGLGVLRRGSADAAVVQQAAEVRDTRRGGRDVRHRARRPQALRDGGHARPHRVLEVRRVDRLAPHLAAAAENKLLAHVGRHQRARLLHVHLLPRHAQAVQVPHTVRAPDHTVARRRRLLHNRRPRQPLLDDRLLVQLRPEVPPQLLPPRHRLAHPEHDVRHPPAEVRVRLVRRPPRRLQPRRHLRRLRPARRVHLVAADVHVVVDRRRRQVLEHRLDHVERLVRVRPQRHRARRRRADLRVPLAPRRRVPRRVHLEQHTHAARTRVLHHVLHVVLRVPLVLRVRPLLRQLRVRRALVRERLQVHNVPVHRVHLRVRERVDRHLQRRHRLVVPRRVHQHLAVREPRRVLDAPRRRRQLVHLSVEVERHQLRQRLHRVVRAELRRRRDRHRRVRPHLQRVRFVHAQLQLRLVVRHAHRHLAHARPRHRLHPVREHRRRVARERRRQVRRRAGTAVERELRRVDAQHRRSVLVRLRQRPDVGLGSSHRGCQAQQDGGNDAHF
eukprot:Rhum_TRINITY_DN15286_c0_g1::Rhum_TRINITY_DN15286_c0_g1_i1::g.147961::m.147961